SKIISILNVSQLLTFSLPDMARDGMPFNEITSTIGVKDGVLSTQDFFIDSNVMHVTSVGKIDSVKETIDMLIGVQPLQTVDRVISRIPVVGWILSGGDGSMITT
ncbi:AsmA-like C-terminal domain-containing protein, partial [bacterium]|nr:AsmA-like C-terminal domain-containing protein [bacterium]